MTETRFMPFMTQSADWDELGGFGPAPSAKPVVGRAVQLFTRQLPATSWLVSHLDLMADSRHGRRWPKPWREKPWEQLLDTQPWGCSVDAVGAESVGANAR